MRKKLLSGWGRFAANHPWRVISGILFLTILASIPASGLKMTMRWSDLLPLKDPLVKKFDSIIREYKNASNSIIVIQGEEKEIKNFAETIVPEIKAITEYADRIDYKIDEEFINEHGFMLVKAKDLRKSVDIYKDLNLVPLLTHINDSFEAVYVADDKALSTKEKEDNAVRYLDGLQFWLNTMEKYIRDTKNIDPGLVEKAVGRFLLGDPYFISQDKSVLLMLVEPTFSMIDMDKCMKSTDAIQAVIDKTLKRFPGVKAGLTGSIPLTRDEMYHQQKDMEIISVVALILVLLVFIITFRMWSVIFLAGFILILIIIVAAGIGAIFLESLNMMTSIFAVILIGLGIDYCIHIISIYNERRKTGEDPVTAMSETLLRSGSGIITGGLTTAIAFFTLMVSDTRGIREMGLMLGIGITTAMVITIIGMPALLVARERLIGKIRRRSPRTVSVDFKVLEKLGKWVQKRPIFFLSICGLVTIFFIYQAINLKFDYNYLNLEPKGLESIILQDVMIDTFDVSPDFAMVTTTSIEDSYEISEKAKRMPTVSMVETISNFVPLDSQQNVRRKYVEKIRKYLTENIQTSRITKYDIVELNKQLERLEMNIYELGQMAYLGGQDKVDLKTQQIIGDPEKTDSQNFIINLIGRINNDPEGSAKSLNIFQDNYQPILREKALKMANPEQISVGSLPESIKSRYLNREGNNYLVTIFPKEQIWDFAYLRRFTDQMLHISPDITGNAPMWLRFMDYLYRDGIVATLLALFTVFIFLWIDFRSIRIALMAIIPLIVGSIWMLGLLKTSGLMLTMINVMAIPMIVGIGIDDGVHLIHRYKIEGFDKTPLVLKSTGKAIMLTSLTTMVGFGSLLLAKYRGFGSMGIFLVLGVGACFLTTVLVLPAISGIITKKRS